MQTDVVPHPSDQEIPPHLSALPEQGEVLIAASQAPKYLGVKTQTLARWRHEGFGPPWIAVGRRVFYQTTDLKVWIESRKRQNTVREESHHGATA